MVICWSHGHQPLPEQESQNQVWEVSMFFPGRGCSSLARICRIRRSLAEPRVCGNMLKESQFLFMPVAVQKHWKFNLPKHSQSGYRQPSATVKKKSASWLCRGIANKQPHKRDQCLFPTARNYGFRHYRCGLVGKQQGLLVKPVAGTA